MNIFENYQFEEDVLELMIAEYMEKHLRLGHLGEVDSPVIDLSMVSHEVVSLTPTSFEYSILKTPMGDVLRTVEKQVVFKPHMIGIVDDGKITSGEIISINAIKVE